ncbi:hypothetical protein HW115_14370 [Verrucomicrobiaceae bacterium N1E253]|uniref:Sialate O-acetylesterase domain-containing protein n=1 Tax=Oceaniferula marina TaxID=2748318 RepID=A0A851GRG7_9BACT|nr:sialate O-acetylesterase [Oceaniferula marina]NWK56804.1 hypothetical protein [Oceaniferula marina]
MIKPFLLFFTATCLLSTAAPVDVYLFGGQSNMQGIGKIAELGQEDKKAIPNARFFNGTSFTPITPGTTKTSHRKGEFGPEIGFARWMSQHDQSVHIIKYAASGMPLHHGWNGNRWQGGVPTPKRRNFYPGLSDQDPNQGTLYRAMIKRFQQGVENLKKQGHTPVIKGFVWVQGEQDSKHEISASQYAKSILHLRQRIAEDMDCPMLPMALPQVLPHEPAKDRFTHRKEIRAELQALKHTRIQVIDSADWPLKADTVHYNAQGQLALGKAMAKALFELQKASSAPDPSR